MAQAFRFRLETLLRVREMREREAKRTFGTQLAEIAALDRQNEQARQEITRSQQALVARQSQPQVDPVDLIRGRAWTAMLRRSIVLRDAEKQRQQQKLEELRRVLVEAQKQRKTIDRLREKRWTEYQDDRRRREQSDADETARALHWRAHAVEASA